MRVRAIVFAVAILASTLGSVAASAQEAEELRSAQCIGGMAGEFPCSNVDLIHYFTMEELGGGTEVGTGRGNDVWGWSDPETGREYVLAGRENGTAIVDISNLRRPLYLANLPTAAPEEDADRIWRDIKVYADHAYIVSEGGAPSFQHGLQVLDLTRLRALDPADAPVTLEEDTVYRGFETAHNVFVNEDTGFAYAVGARNLDRTLSCAGGLHMIDLSDPGSPAFAGCFDENGYIHDVQCVVYGGPDRRFTGREICFASNPPTGGSAGPDFVTIVDVTDKANPAVLSATEYEGSGFSHQGWLTENHRFFLHGDELDELNFGHNTLTRVWDAADLTAPELIGTFESSAPATDHNMYVRNRYLYQSNYRAGLRILDLRNVGAGELQEVAFFDVYPPNDDPGFSFGTWSNYPFFNRNVVAVHGYQGLWLLRPRPRPGAGAP
jgi:choice-of-anchor B domain-containing protein